MKKVAQRQQSGGEAIAPLQSRTGRIAHPPLTAPRFSHDFSRVPLRAKLKVGAPGDAFEREADRVADEVMRTPEPVVQRSCGCGGSCDDCSQKDEPGAIRRKSTADVAVQDTEHAAEVLRSPGMPLDAETRASLEPRFGHDFSRVRVHTGTGAAQSAAALSARAYTVGHDIVFGAGEYRPQTGDGRRLLAHELTHVAQQSGGEESIRRAPAPPPGQTQTPAPAPPKPGTAAAAPSLKFEPSQNGVPCACLVFIHNDESTAKKMADLLFRKCRYNLTVLTGGEANKRRVKIGTGDVDPNELFPREVAEQCWASDKPCEEYKAAHAGDTSADDIKEYMRRQFFLEIKHCSNGFTLPIVGLHNNSIADTARYRREMPPKAELDAIRGKTYEKKPAPGGKLSSGSTPFADLEAWLLKSVKGMRKRTTPDPKNPEQTVENVPEYEEVVEKGKKVKKLKQHILSEHKTNIFLWCTLRENSMCHPGDPEHPDNVVWVTNRADFDALAKTNVNVALQTGDFDTDLSTLFVKLPQISADFAAFRTKLAAEVAVDRANLQALYKSLAPLLKLQSLLEPEQWMKLASPLIPALRLMAKEDQLADAQGVTLIDPAKLHFTNIETPEETTPDAMAQAYRDVKAVLGALNVDCCDAAASAEVEAGMRAVPQKAKPKKPAKAKKP